MLRKIGKCKWVMIALFFSLVVAFFAAPARCNFGDTPVEPKAGLKYSVAGTECFVSWNFGFFINVTYVNTTHAFGKVNNTVDDEDLSKNSVIPSGENISLSIFILRSVTDWNERPNINNVSESQLLEHWNATYLNTHDSGVYNDLTRNTVSINYNIWTPAPPGGVDVTQNLKIAWDNDTGVLVEYNLVQSAVDPQFSGSWSIILAETTLWGISPEIVPGYPIEILLVTFIASICGFYLSKKMRRCVIQ